MPLKTAIKASIVAAQTGALDLAGQSVSHALEVALNLANGTLANQANKIFSDTRSLAASANENLDLAGALTDALGVSLTFTQVKAIMFRAKSTNVNDVVVGGVGTNAFVGPFGASTHTIAVKPGGILLLAAPGLTGWPVTAGTADLLRVANGGAGSAVDYDVVIVGI